MPSFMMSTAPECVEVLVRILPSDEAFTMPSKFAQKTHNLDYVNY
ncbi:hypothetical protein GGE09_002863 [Roseobacter sp. N2S]|nr:hypothetical protein [Roseobacter sp. N2S]